MHTQFDKAAVATLLGSVLVKIGRNDLRAAGQRLADSRRMLLELAVQQNKTLVDAPNEKPATAVGVSNLTMLVTMAIVRMTKNDLQGSYTRVNDSIAMVQRMTSRRRGGAAQEVLPVRNPQRDF